LRFFFNNKIINDESIIDIKNVTKTKKSNDEILLNGFIKANTLYRFSMSIYLSAISNKSVDIVAKDTRKTKGNKIILFKIQFPCVIY